MRTLPFTQAAVFGPSMGSSSAEGVAVSCTLAEGQLTTMSVSDGLYGSR